MGNQNAGAGAPVPTAVNPVSESSLPDRWDSVHRDEFLGIVHSLGPHGLAVYLAIKLRCGKGKDSCWPSLDAIALDTGIHRSTVQAKAHKLAGGGWLSLKSGPGRGHSNRYTLGKRSHRTNDKASKPSDETNNRGEMFAQDEPKRSFKATGRRTREDAQHTTARAREDHDEVVKILGALPPHVRSDLDRYGEAQDTVSEWHRQCRAYPRLILSGIIESAIDKADRMRDPVRSWKAWIGKEVEESVREEEEAAQRFLRKNASVRESIGDSLHRLRELGLNEQADEIESRVKEAGEHQEELYRILGDALRARDEHLSRAAA